MPTARHLPVLPDDFDPDLPPERPRTRGDCLPGGSNAERPCPFAGCRHSLILEVGAGGAVRLAVDPDDLDAAAETCSLDVADRAAAGEEVTCDAIGQLLGGVSRERVRQIESAALRKLAKRPGRELAKLRSMGEP